MREREHKKGSINIVFVCLILLRIAVLPEYLWRCVNCALLCMLLCSVRVCVFLNLFFCGALKTTGFIQPQPQGASLNLRPHVMGHRLCVTIHSTLISAHPLEPPYFSPHQHEKIIKKEVFCFFCFNFFFQGTAGVLLLLVWSVDPFGKTKEYNWFIVRSYNC